jgi:thiol-disulfide isomerase/thioredoxin
VNLLEQISMMRLRPALALLLTSLVAPGCSKSPCGNGQIDEGEQCDGDNMNGLGCAAVGFAYGTLKCTSGCLLDTQACITDPCWAYPCGNRGSDIGDVIPNLQFEPGNDTSAAVSSLDGLFGLDDLFANNVAHGGSLKGVLFFVSARWCPVCADEAVLLESLHTEYANRGVIVVGLVLEDVRGNQATPTDAVEYAHEHGWSFPTVAATLDATYWHGDNGPSYPMNLFVDASNMRLTGRIEGGAPEKLLRLGLDELATGIAWPESGERPVSFDCAPDTGSEVEPNGLSETPADASSLPYTLSGTICPPFIAEDLKVDEDVADLGVLTAGTAITVSMERLGTSKNYPFFVLARLDEAQQLAWQHYSTVHVDGSAAMRQFVVPATGHYYAAAEDGRMSAWLYYGTTAIPYADDCCEGGTDYTYSMTIDTHTLAATEPAVSVGTDRLDTVSDELLRVYPIAMTAAVSYTIGMQAVDSDQLDPTLLLVDPATGAVVAQNDDVDAANRKYNAQIVWTPAADITLWIVADYVSAGSSGGAPEYHLTVN